jgi:hypothetical protein
LKILEAAKMSKTVDQRAGTNGGNSGQGGGGKSDKGFSINEERGYRPVNSGKPEGSNRPSGSGIIKPDSGKQK